MEALAQPYGQGSDHMAYRLPVSLLEWGYKLSTLPSYQGAQAKKPLPPRIARAVPSQSDVTTTVVSGAGLWTVCLHRSLCSDFLTPLPSSSDGLSPWIHIWFILVIKKAFLARGLHFQEGFPSSVGVRLTREGQWLVICFLSAASPAPGHFSLDSPLLPVWVVFS